MSERATADLVGLPVFVAGIVAAIEAAFHGAGTVTAFVGGGVVTGLLFAFAAAAWSLSRVARWLLPARWCAEPFPAAVVVSVLLFLAAFVPAAAAVAARHRDPQMVSVVVAVLGVALAWLVMAIALPLVARVLRRLGPFVERIPRPRWSRLITLATLAWALSAMGWILLGSPPSVRGELAVRATHAWTALTDVDGDGRGAIQPPARARGRR
jgi:hypothetical protein